MNPRDAAIEVCQRILPQPVLDEETGKMKPSWATGNTKLFAKDSTPMVLLHWYDLNEVAGHLFSDGQRVCVDSWDVDM